MFLFGTVRSELAIASPCWHQIQEPFHFMEMQSLYLIKLHLLVWETSLQKYQVDTFERDLQNTFSFDSASHCSFHDWVHICCSCVFCFSSRCLFLKPWASWEGRRGRTFWSCMSRLVTILTEPGLFRGERLEGIICVSSFA